MPSDFCDGSCGYTACPHTHPKKEDEPGWEEVFDKLFTTQEGGFEEMSKEAAPRVVRGFIKTVVHRERSRIIEEIKSLKYNNGRTDRPLSTFEIAMNMAIDRIVEKLV